MPEHYMATKMIPFDVDGEREIVKDGVAKTVKTRLRRHWKAGRVVDRAALEKGTFDKLLAKGSIIALKESEISAAADRYAITSTASATDEAKFKGTLKTGSSTDLEDPAEKPKGRKRQ